MKKLMLVAVGFGLGFAAATLLLKREFEMEVEDIRVDELSKKATYKEEEEEPEDKGKDDVECAAEEEPDKSGVGDDIYEIDADQMGDYNQEIQELTFYQGDAQFMTDDGEIMYDVSNFIGVTTTEYYYNGGEEEKFIRNEKVRTDFDIIVSEDSAGYYDAMGRPCRKDPDVMKGGEA